jgi:hypothetical protein
MRDGGTMYSTQRGGRRDKNRRSAAQQQYQQDDMDSDGERERTAGLPGFPNGALGEDVRRLGHRGLDVRQVKASHGSGAKSSLFGLGHWACDPADCPPTTPHI